MDPSPECQSPPKSRPWNALLGLLGIWILAVIAFLPAMDAPLAFDDVLSIKQVRGFESWTDAFGADPFNFYRPVKNLFFYAMGQTNGDTFNYHLGTLAAYLLATTGVFILARRLCGSPNWALVAAAIWTFTAANATVAIWASCFNISIAAAAITFGLTAWDRWRETPSRSSGAILFFLALIIGLLSYETAVAMAPLAVMIDLYRGRRIFTKPALARYALIAATVVAWVILRHQMGAKSGATLNPSFPADTARWQISASSPFFLWTHLSMWAAPWGRLECLGSYLWNLSVPSAILPFCWFFLLGIAALAARFWQAGNLVVFGLAWFLIAFIPSGNFIPLGNTPYADYYVAIPSIGLALTLTAVLRALVGLARRSHRDPNVTRVAWAAWAAFAILIAWRAATLTEMNKWIRTWQDPVMIMAESSTVRPGQHLAKAVVARVMLSAENYDTARQFAEASLEDSDDLAVADTVLGEIEYRQGNKKKAAEHFTASLAEDRRHLSDESKLDAHLRLGQIMAEDPARLDEAFQNHLLAVLKRRDYLRHPEAVLTTAAAFKNAGRPTDELATLQKGATYHPDNQPILDALKEASQRQTPPSGES